MEIILTSDFLKRNLETEFEEITNKYKSLKEKKDNDIQEILEKVDLYDVYESIVNEYSLLLSEIEEEIKECKKNEQLKLEKIKDNISYYKNLNEKLDELEEHRQCLDRVFKFSNEFRTLYKEARNEYLFFMLCDVHSFPIKYVLADDSNDENEDAETLGEIFAKDFNFTKEENYYVSLFKKILITIKNITK